MPIRIRQDDADLTRSGSTTRKNTGLGFRGVGDKVHMSTLSDRRITCLSEEARGSSQGHRYLRQVQTENKKLLFVSYCTKNCAVPGTVPTYGDRCIYST
jgi:hypothetical protein